MNAGLTSICPITQRKCIVKGWEERPQRSLTMHLREESLYPCHGVPTGQSWLWQNHLVFACIRRETQWSWRRYEIFLFSYTTFYESSSFHYLIICLRHIVVLVPSRDWRQTDLLDLWGFRDGVHRGAASHRESVVIRLAGYDVTDFGAVPHSVMCHVDTCH